MEIMKLRAKAKTLEPILRIGKNGLTDAVIEEIKKLLRKKRLIKVKMLKSALENKNKKEAVKDLVNKTDAVLIEAVGFVVVLAKK
jgi:RNA-binding protein